MRAISESTMSDDDVFAADNKYRPEHGEPPDVSREEYYFTSYFENKHGDQLVFIYDEDEERAYVYNGRSGWDSVTEVGKEDIEDGDFHVHFNQFDGEARWLEACVKSLQPRFKMQYDG